MTVVPFTIVREESNSEERGSPTMSRETIGSSVYPSMPTSGPDSEAARKAALTSSTVVSRPTWTVRSTTEPSGVGTRSAMPSSFPFRAGMTSPIARAAPVEVGMIDSAAARARRRSLWGRSRMRWSFVYAWQVVMKPCSMPTVSISTLASGARQLVVQEAFEMTWCCSGSYSSSLTPMQTVRSGPLAGAEMITLLAPASRCRAALSRPVKRPVLSITTSTPRSLQGRLAGSRSASTRTSAPSTRMWSSCASTVPG